MGLPKIDQPIFTLTIPSTGKKVKYRPFTVKEEKILLIAKESKDGDQIVEAIKQIISNCVQGDIEVDPMPVFDLEYILVQLRSKSVNNIVSFKIKDNGQEIPLEVNLDDVQVTRNDNHSNRIPISDDTYIFMKYPNLQQIDNLMKTEKIASEALLDILIACIDKVVVGESVYKMEDETEEDRTNFVNNLPSKTMNSLKQFFETMPKVSQEILYKRKDGTDGKFILSGLQAFFI